MDSENKVEVGLETGTVLKARYRVDEIIGMGGFGITYRAWDLVFERQVAMKEYFPVGIVTRTQGMTVSAISRNLTESLKHGIRRFLQEARDLMRFQENPGIVSVLDFFEENGTAYMVMEYLDGCTLKDYLAANQGKIDDAMSIHVIFSLMKVLEAVHAEGLVHRDISPDNVYICRNRSIKLIDFGAAKIVNQDVNSSSVVLKHGYAPVEQYSKNGNIGPWTDVYAFGALVYYMKTGVRPVESVERIIADELVPPKTLNPAISDHLNRVIMKALSIKPEDRYQNMGEMSADFLADENDRPVQATQQTPQPMWSQQTPQPMWSQQTPQQKTQPAWPQQTAQPAWSQQNPQQMTQSAWSQQTPQTTQQTPQPAWSPANRNPAPVKPTAGGSRKKLILILSTALAVLIAGMIIFFATRDSGHSSGSGGTASVRENVTTGTATENKTVSTEGKTTESTRQAASTEQDTQAKAQHSVIKVGVINSVPGESGYREANVKDIEALFTKENGYELATCYSLKNDEQIAGAKRFIQDGFDYILLCAADTSGWDAVLRDAKTAGVKVILFDRTIDVDPSLYDALVVADMNIEGDKAVNWLLDQNLKTYNVIHLQGAIGSEAQIGRSTALDSQFASGKMKKVIQQSASWDEAEAKKIVETVIKSGEDFNVIYAENDGMAKGAVAALDEAGITHGVNGKVVIVSFDCNKWALSELLAKNWNYDGQCSPFQAKDIDGVIRKLESGQTLDQKTVLIDEKGFDAATITQQDVDDYGI